MMRTTPQTSPLGKIVALAASAILLVLGFMFSVIVLAVVIVGGLAGLGYFWWKTRRLRKAMREQQGPVGEDGGHVIEGEAVVVEKYRTDEQDVLPGESGENEKSR